MRGSRTQSTSSPARSAVLVALGVGVGVVVASALLPGVANATRGRIGLAAAQGQPQNTPQGLEILGNSCQSSNLDAHTGFQDGNRCVATAMGEVGDAANNPSLLITKFPAQVQAGQAFQLEVSTRKLIRDRFLGAAAGGYYLESSFLNDQGLQRGHFHTACRILGSTTEAPDAAPAPAFFKATEDGGGGNQPDTVTIDVTGVNQAGTLQCSVWAGDGSHRTPMMQRANQTPAFDSVRIEVVGGGGGQNNGGQNNGGQNNGGQNNGGQNNGGQNNGGQNNGGQNNGQNAGQNGGQAGNAGAISCPTVKDKLPAIPASANAEVQRNLALLDTQIAAANKRLATLGGRSNSALVRNTVLLPLQAKRLAALERMAVAISRTAARPTGLGKLAACTVKKA